MTVDLYALLATCVIYFVIPYVHNIPRTLKGGSEWALGSRAENPETPEWVERTERAHRNFSEWFPIFAALVLTVHVAGAQSAVTAGAALVYAAARVAYTAAYALGSRLRAPLWYLSSLCLLSLLVEAVRA